MRAGGGISAHRWRRFRLSLDGLVFSGKDPLHKTHGAQIPLNLHRKRLTLRRSALFFLGAGRDRRIRTAASGSQNPLPCTVWLCLRISA